MFKSLIISSILAINITFAANYYVDTNNPNASDSNPGTEALPFKTIQKGIDVAFAGDIVFVKNGTYTPGSSGLNMVRSGSSGQKIVFKAYPGHNPVIQFPSSNSPERGWNWNGYRDYLVIDGFEIIGAKYAVLIQGSYNEVLNCKIHDTGSDALCIWGGSYNRYAYNEVYNAGWNGIYIEAREYNGSHGAAHYNIIEYNNSHHNSSHFGINIFPETGNTQVNMIGNIIRYNFSHHNGGGVYLRRFKDGEIYGNIIYMNGSSSSGNGLFFHKSSSDTQPFLSNTKVYNNTLDDNDPYWNVANDVFEGCDFKNNIFLNANIRHTYSTTQDYNLYFNSTGDISGSHNVIADPLLNSDYTLQSNSPAIDAGVDLGSPYNMDMFGNIRGNDGAWDIGACEMSGTDTTPPKVTGAVLLDSVTLRIDFSENLEQSSAQNENNYSINNGITVQNASLSGSQVTLNTSVHSTGNYLVTVSNVTDPAGNIIDPTQNSAQYEWTSESDITPPQVVSASLIDSITLKIIFTEALEQSSAENINNYSINNGVSVTSASVSGAEVTLNTTMHSTGSYTVTVVNIQDLAGNQIEPPNNTANYEWNSTSSLEQLQIVFAEASSVPEPEHSPEKAYDGMGYFQGDPDSRWAGEPIPSWISFDIGGEQEISMSKLSFYNWNAGRTYNYSLQVSSDNTNWNTIVSNANSSSEEWTQNNFTPVNARYFRVVFNSSNQGTWAGLWECEIWGETGVTESDTGNSLLPTEFQLLQNYPNPFNPSTTITINLSENSNVTLKIFNSLGEEVAGLLNSEMQSGIHKINFNASGLSSGIYFYTMIAGNFVQTRKMILLK